ncbi:carbohydrate esterase family 3 protein [Podospora didyma]|uniref:Carbohydrate esterase family 3 protein n=1 Tax=Podospora didyma TaxID=330526 RepID=A0AAE0U0G5_9PEZI|nr:carbohydrate esterase family 3 protein [Podospora didyma]
MTSHPSNHDVEPIKVMIIGDSISHGREGDFTWRYRIWQWFHSSNIPMTFVGPYQGTVPPEDPSPPRPPPLASDPADPPRFPRSDGGYAHGVSEEFLSNAVHFAAGGRQAAQAKHFVAEQVAALQPDLCLVQLGFNDLAWGDRSPAGLLASMKYLIDEARSAGPDVKFAVADVPQCAPYIGREDLPVITGAYNSLLEEVIPEWSSEMSPIALVRFCEVYSFATASYDGLHPNALGEYQLARAFSRALVESFSLGHKSLSVPRDIPPRPLPAPENIRASPTPAGIVVTWSPVYGAFGYDIRARVSPSASSSHWTVHQFAPAQRYDTTNCVPGQEWEYQVRSRAGTKVQSDEWSSSAFAVADPKTLPGPRNVVTHPTSTGFVLRWDPPLSKKHRNCMSEEDHNDEDDKIDRYGVYWSDCAIPGPIPPYVLGVRALEAEVKGLLPGHHYTVAVDTWTAVGGGPPTCARAVTPGLGTPLPPVRVRAVALDEITVRLTWMGDAAAAGYEIWIQEASSSRKDSEDIFSDKTPEGPANESRRLLCNVPASSEHVVSEAGTESLQPSSRLGKQILTGLLPSVWVFEFAVTAYNGDLNSKISEWVVPSPPPPLLLPGHEETDTGPLTLGEDCSINIELEILSSCACLACRLRETAETMVFAVKPL